MATVTRNAIAAAPLEIVWEVLTTSADWDQWADFSASVREREGEDAPDGVGSIRQAWTAGVLQIREEVVTHDRDTGLYAYRLLSGLPLRDYLGRVELVEDDGATHITWTASCRPMVPLPGADQVNGFVLGVAIGRIAQALATEATRQARAIAAEAAP